MLTDVEGVSHVFEQGLIVYSKDAKCELLGIDAHWSMIAAPRADIVLAVTGFADASGLNGKPGHVHFACARRGGTTMHHEEFRRYRPGRHTSLMAARRACHAAGRGKYDVTQTLGNGRRCLPVGSCRGTICGGRCYGNSNLVAMAKTDEVRMLFRRMSQASVTVVR